MWGPSFSYLATERLRLKCQDVDGIHLLAGVDPTSEVSVSLGERIAAVLNARVLCDIRKISAIQAACPYHDYLHAIPKALVI